MRQCLRWRVEHDGEEKSYGSRGMLSERDTMKTRGDGGDVIVLSWTIYVYLYYISYIYLILNFK